MNEIYFAHDEQESPVARTGQLAMAGYRVTLFRGGDELCTALGRHKPDLVVLDVLLRGAHGFDVCRRIRASFAREELPVIVMSDIYRSRAYRDEATLAGAQAYLLRPIRPEDLWHQVAALVGAEHPASR
jgi:DNA-binding response OmpR family regulator